MVVKITRADQMMLPIIVDTVQLTNQPLPAHNYCNVQVDNSKIEFFIKTILSHAAVTKNNLLFSRFYVERG